MQYWTFYRLMSMCHSITAGSAIFCFAILPTLVRLIWLFGKCACTFEGFQLVKLWKGHPLLSIRCLHISCSLLCCCPNFWQQSGSPNSSGLPVFPLLLSVCRSLFLAFILCQLQLVWQIRSQVAVATCPICTISLARSSLDCVTPSHPTPQNAHTTLTFKPFLQHCFCP